MRKRIYFYISAVIATIILSSCDKHTETRWIEIGTINSLRVDDDSEFHVQCDSYTESDIYKFNMSIVRKKGSGNKLYERYDRMCFGKSCERWNRDWSYKAILEPDFKIETFED